ncbi:hypothetical protein BURCENBC7_AP5177 [Burkholderia cenocepacia BC7]|nr:hypothetical protein BURCENK562V_C2156 [Burkholderia cenocepacia K56-2Valvano]ERI27388.1 hypothetical protein BURCENBC7_AP5177 [Burkholderia cenocepacia BC7]
MWRSNVYLKTDTLSRVRQHGRREAHAAVAFAATGETRVVPVSAKPTF